MENLDSDLLRTFVAVFECDGFSSASEYLNKTQSTISQRLSKLEDMVGCPLVIRSSRVIKLTPAGEDFLVYARQILKLHSEAIDVAQFRQTKSVLKIGMPDDYAQRYLPAVLSYFKKNYPNLVPEVVCETSVFLIEKVMKGELDIALAIKHNSTVQGEFICNESLVWAASSDFVPKEHTMIPLSAYPEGCVFRANGISALAKNSLAWRVVYTSQSPSGISISVNSGDSVTITSKRLMPDHWRELTNGDGYPDISPSELMIYQSPVFENSYSSCFIKKISESLGILGNLRSNLD